MNRLFSPNLPLNSLLFSLAASSLNAEQFGLFTYSVANGEVTITDYPRDTMGEVVIPSEIEGLPVTTIGETAFYACADLTIIIIPDSVTTIENGDDDFGFDDDSERGPFMRCENLVSVSIPSTVTLIGDYAFRGCRSLTTIIVPGSVDRIGEEAFAYSGLTSVTFEEGVTVIDKRAFGSCSGLTTVDLPSSITSIGDGAFSNCAGLTSVTIPPEAILNGQPFRGCAALTSIEVDPLNPFYRSVDGVLFSPDLTELRSYPCGKTGKYNIPGNVTSIAGGAFASCTGATAVTIPGSITSLEGAFTYCIGLTRVTIEEGVTTIGNHEFGHCPNLTAVSLPESLTEIGSVAFDACPSLRSIVIPAGVVNIGDSAFNTCPNLNAVLFLGDAPNSLGRNVFSSGSPGFTIYYLADSTGFSSPTWEGYPAVMLDEAPDEKETWLLGQGLPLTTSLHEDPDGDGSPLLLAYALDRPRGTLPNLVADGENLTLAFYGGRPDISYTAQASTNLKTWTTDGVTLTSPGAGGWRSASVATNGGQRFLRVVVAEE